MSTPPDFSKEDAMRYRIDTPEEERERASTDPKRLFQPEMVFHQLYEMLDQELAHNVQQANRHGAIAVMSAVAAAGVHDDGGRVSQLARDFSVSQLHQEAEPLTDAHWRSRREEDGAQSSSAPCPVPRDVETADDAGTQDGARSLLVPSSSSRLGVGDYSTEKSDSVEDNPSTAPDS